MTLSRLSDKSYTSDKAAKAFIILALAYLLFGLLLGVTGGFQYLLPSFLKSQLSFQRTRPLHVYLVITWIFTAAQAGVYYYMCRIANRQVYWPVGVWVHFILQLGVSIFIIASFFLGYFGGREYLEFPPLIGAFILLSWIPFAVNFFFTLKPKYKTAPVYIWMWSTGILFFFITVSESYLWIFEHFRTNIIRDITVQWKALGSMVGSWNMLVYGTGMYIMEQTSGENKTARTPLAFFFYFLSLTNLMFNWGHHTYIVPAAPWVKTVAYVISMTELLILAHIIWHWRKTITKAKKNYHIVSYRLLSFADIWVLLNLVLAISISVPALNFFTHGTHITVAHAMGATIGINTMLLLASLFFIAQQLNPVFIENNKARISKFLWFTNISLLTFWLALLGMGFMKIYGKINNQPFQLIMEKSSNVFRIFSYSGVLVMTGLLALIFIALRSFSSRTR